MLKDLDRGQIFRLTLFLLLTAGAFVYSTIRLDCTNYGRLQRHEQSVDVQKRVIDTYTSQSEQLATWSLTLLGAIVAIAVTTKVHPVRFFSSAFVALGPGGAFFFGSLRASWQFQRRVANMIAHDDLSDLPSLASLLLQQLDLFRAGLACAGLFGAWYLVNIVVGSVEPYENERKAR